MYDDNTEVNADLSWREKGYALYRVGKFRPLYALSVIGLSLIAAILEGIGLSFILPIVEIIGSDGIQSGEVSGFLELFVEAYRAIGVPFTLVNLIVGVSVLMTIRYTMSFFVDWLRADLQMKYLRYLQKEAFENALTARLSYFDTEGNDDILNTIVTQAEYAGLVIRYVTSLLEQGILFLVYLSIALAIAPFLTVIAIVGLGSLVFIIRNRVDSGYSVGEQVADANARIQNITQAATMGIRDVKLFGLKVEFQPDFNAALDQFVRSQVKLRRNQAGMNNFYQLATALAIFGLIFLALRVFSLSLSVMGLFLFTMLRLSPRVSRLNSQVYNVEGKLPHLVRTQQFINHLKQHQEPDTAKRSVPAEVAHITFDNVSFRYETADETALTNISFTVEKGEFIAFVGQSGAGKSTITSLLTRMYEPDSGEILANEIPISKFDIDEWRSRVAVVRQNPHIFNDTLRRNVTIGNRNATQAEIEQVCEFAQVTEFLGELPHGYDTVLGDDGVKLSGGQRQRVAIARALLKDAELLVLDEATSDLDSSLEEQVHDAIAGMDRDYALLVIAHRLSTVADADRIYTIEDGEIVEAGDHSELLTNEGTYSQLYSLQ